MPILLPALLLACAPDLPVEAETEGRPAWDGEWPVAHGRAVVLDDGALFLEGPGLAEGQDLVPLAREVVGPPALSRDGTRLAFSHKVDGPSLSVLDAVTLGPDGPEVRRLVAEDSPDRVALSADGAWIAFVNGPTGIASVYALPFAGGTPVQLTNRDLVRIPGQAPLGFVAPPHEDPLAIVDHEVRWNAPDGPHAVALP